MRAARGAAKHDDDGHRISSLLALTKLSCILHHDRAAKDFLTLTIAPIEHMGHSWYVRYVAKDKTPKELTTLHDLVRSLGDVQGISPVILMATEEQSHCCHPLGCAEVQYAYSEAPLRLDDTRELILGLGIPEEDVSMVAISDLQMEDSLILYEWVRARFTEKDINEHDLVSMAADRIRANKCIEKFGSLQELLRSSKGSAFLRRLQMDLKDYKRRLIVRI